MAVVAYTVAGQGYEISVFSNRTFDTDSISMAFTVVQIKGDRAMHPATKCRYRRLPLLADRPWKILRDWAECCRRTSYDVHDVGLVR